MTSRYWTDLKNYLEAEADERGWLKERIVVTARALSGVEAIGRPSHDDYPLLKGKESIVEAVIKDARGHAFTDTPGHFRGTIEDVLALPLSDNYERAIFIATLNAVLRKAGLIEGTVHCKDDAPVECARELAAYVAREFGSPKVFQVGYQPRMAEELSRRFDFRITDMDADNIGKQVGKARIEPDSAATDPNIAWCDVIIATGTTFANDTAQKLVDCGVPVIFYGVTCAGAAHVLGLTRFCTKAT